MLSKENKNEILTTTVYNGGGGSGRAGLEFEHLFNEQCSMYARTVNKNSDFQVQHLAQEKRQISVIDLPVTIHINVAREDFPSISSRICIIYVPSAAQQAWAKLLKDICKTLKIDFIHSLLDRVDKSPVHRIMRLRPEGDYLVRQRETSSILEVINTGITPVEVSWGITMDINDVKQALALDGRNMHVIDRRIADLVAKPVVRETQRDISTLIISAVSPKVAVGVMLQFHKQYKPTGADAQDAEHENKVGDSEILNFGDIKKYGEAIDIVSLHRICLETLGRFAANGRSKNIATSPCFEYVCDVIEGLRQEVGVVALGLKLLSDVSKYLVDEREKVFHVVLNCVQAYAPPEQKHRPRNPKRLRSPEELFEETAALNGIDVGYSSNTFAKGDVNIQEHGSDSVRHNNNISHPQGGGAASSGRAAAVEGPNQSRYGDFYGHSAPAIKGSVVEWSQAVTLHDMSSSGGADIVSRLQWRDKVPSKESDTQVSATLSKNTVDTSSENTKEEVEIKALVRGRVRRDHHAASQALQTAFQTSAPPSASSMASSVSGSNNLIVQQRDTPIVPVDAAEAEFLKEQKEFQEKQKQKQPKFQFKFKRKGEVHQNDPNNTTETEKKLQWKGTIGEIGRKAPEKIKEVVIDFKKKIVYDPNSEVSGQEEGVENIPIETPKTTEELATAAAEEADNAAVLEALQAAASAVTNKRKKKRHHKLTIAPLPLVPCVQFRGFSGRSKQTLAMMQSFATMFKLISQNYGNRDVAFKMGLVEEVSVVITVCQGMPRVLDYYIWVIDALYRDGFGELSMDELDIAVDDHTMVLSNNPEAETTAKKHPDRDTETKAGNENGSMTGFQFETISEMSIPSFDQDGLHSEATPIVNIGAPLSAEEIATAEAETSKARRRETRRLGMQTSGAGTEEGSRIGTDNAINEIAPEISNQLKKAANQTLINALGLYEFEARYVKRPADEVVLGVALISIHPELETREKMLALKWLDVWDDGSRSYKTLKKKGMDLAGL